jgi:hypothetical protein
MQCASDARKSERSAQAFHWRLSELDDRPLAAHARTEQQVAHASGETSTEPQAILDELKRTLASDTLNGWQAVVAAAGQLTQARRAALEPAIIECLSSFATRESANLASWPPNKWVFFDLVAALEAEYGWRVSDRPIYATLDEQPAQAFIRLLKWAQQSVTPAGMVARTDVDNPEPERVSHVDLHHFYDRGRDRKGLEAYWRMVSDVSLWRAHDAATDLFLPAWNVQDKRYGRACLGLLGWTALAVAFAPWRHALPSTGSVLDSGLEVVSGMLLMIVALWTIVGSAPPHSPHRKTQLVGPLWDSSAFFAFPSGPWHEDCTCARSSGSLPGQRSFIRW